MAYAQSEVTAEARQCGDIRCRESGGVHVGSRIQQGFQTRDWRIARIVEEEERRVMLLTVDWMRNVSRG